jgi:hypothetical protein
MKNYMEIRYGMYQKELGRRLCIVLCNLKNPNAKTITGEAIYDCLCDYNGNPDACSQCEIPTRKF